jgi:hypothetical protein
MEEKSYAITNGTQTTSNSFIKLINEFADNYTDTEYSIDIARKIEKNIGKGNGNAIKGEYLGILLHLFQQILL